MTAVATPRETAPQPLDEIRTIAVLKSSLYPGASDASIRMVLDYCQAAGLDPFMKPVHIVPMWDQKSRQMRDVIMPGVNLYRINAARTGECAGISEPEFGPLVTANLGGEMIEYPEWARVVVKRVLPSGVVAEYVARELWIENYAQKGGPDKSPAPNAMWRRRVFGQLAKCFDSETEVLTTNGFQRFSEVTGRILQVTENGLEPCDASPFMQEYAGPMIVADGERLNFAVTPNHEMLTTSGSIAAGNLYEKAGTAPKFFIPRAPRFNRPDAPVLDEILKLVGYYMADGSHTGYRQMRIAVSRPYKIDALRELDLHQRESVKRDAGRVAVTSDGREIITALDKTTFTYDFSLIEAFVDSAKILKLERVLALSQRQARVIVDALLEFDGAETNGTRRLSQRNANVLREFEWLAVQAGYSISQRKMRYSDIGNAETVTVSIADDFPVVRGVADNKASLTVRRNTSGNVWCVTVPSHVIVVRRRGFSMLCHQCAEAQALRKAFPEHNSAPTAEEMEGKPIDPSLEVQVFDIDGRPEELVIAARAAADKGTESYSAWWQSITKQERQIMAGDHAAFKVRAQAADAKQRTAAAVEVTADAVVADAPQEPSPDDEFMAGYEREETRQPMKGKSK